MKSFRFRVLLSFTLGLLVVAIALGIDYFRPGIHMLPSGLSLPRFIALLAGIWSSASLLTLGILWFLSVKGQPESETMMIGRLFRLISIIVIIMAFAYGFNILGTFGTLFSLFGGMLLGWSLQAPVSGFAAWILISVKRPFRPGDRVQLPNLGVVGDVVDIGAMYVVLNQVGGTVGSEEAVGRHVLVPNAMLFNQLVINYTVHQEAAFMLDEVVVRITYDSDMEKAEHILLSAATEITQDIIATTGKKPYIRSDFWDYGLLMRLRFQTRVQDRAKIAYEITKRIMQSLQQEPSVDLAIPYVYSYRAGSDRKEDDASRYKEGHYIQNVDITMIRPPPPEYDDPHDIEQIVRSIAADGLLQPIVIKVMPGGAYEIVAGQLRFQACKRLGWKTIPAIIKSSQTENLRANGGASQIHIRP